MLWSKLIKTEVMHKTMRYLEEKGILELYVPNSQDQLVNFYLYHYSQSLLALREFGIYYFIRPGSATQIMRHDNRRYLKLINSHIKVLNIFYKNRMEETFEQVKKYYDFWFRFFISRFANYKDKYDENFIRYIEYVIQCDFCSLEFKEKVLDAFGLRSINYSKF